VKVAPVWNVWCSRSYVVVQLMRMEGMKEAAYWVGTYAFNFVYFLITAFVYVFAGYMIGIKSVKHASPVLFIAVLGLWAHAQSGVAFLFGAIFPRARFASIVLYMLIVLVRLCAMLTGVWSRDVGTGIDVARLAFECTGGHHNGCTSSPRHEPVASCLVVGSDAGLLSCHHFGSCVRR